MQDLCVDPSYLVFQVRQLSHAAEDISDPGSYGSAVHERQFQPYVERERFEHEGSPVHTGRFAQCLLPAEAVACATKDLKTNFALFLG